MTDKKLEDLQLYETGRLYNYGGACHKCGGEVKVKEIAVQYIGDQLINGVINKRFTPISPLYCPSCHCELGCIEVYSPLELAVTL